MIASNSILQNRYRILQQLGRGGMGAVYQAMDENLNCLVAVKETFATTDEHRNAFEREAKLLANLSHPALPRVMHHFREQEGQFLVMQFIPGNDLAELLALRERPFAVVKVLEWADHLLDALEELHTYRPPIIHRDIKPANLKVTPKGKIILLDFGLAKGAAGNMSTINDSQYSSQSVFGYTHHYAPLEQMQGTGTDPRSDLYSLAATLWTLLTAEIPPDALVRVVEKNEERDDPLRPANEINGEVPAAVADVLQRAMSLNRNHRPASAMEMRRQLREAGQDILRRHAGELPTYLASGQSGRSSGESAQQQQRAEAEARERREAEERAEAARQAEAQRAAAEEAKEREREEERQRAAELEARRQKEEQQREAEAQRQREAEGERELQAERESSQVKTMAGAPPDISSWDRRAGTDNAQASTVAKPKGGLTKWFIIAPIVLATLVGAVWWMQSGTSETQQTSAEQSSQQVNTKSSDAGATTSTTRNVTPPAGMAYVPGGNFMMGRSDGGQDVERPAHSVTVKPFFIGAFEVTNEDYQKFTKATGHRAPTTWTDGSYAGGTARYPVTGVTWDDANDYAKWAGKRLPTEEEWEFAARGTDGRLYPWGNEWRSEISTKTNGLRDVGSYTLNKSPFGAFDMTGNAWEWTASAFAAYPGGQLPRGTQPGNDLKVIRGGSYESSKEFATTTYRVGWLARGEKTYDQTGFRLAQDVAKN